MDLTGVVPKLLRRGVISIARLREVVTLAVDDEWLEDDSGAVPDGTEADGTAADSTAVDGAASDGRTAWPTVRGRRCGGRRCSARRGGADGAAAE